MTMGILEMMGLQNPFANIKDNMSRGPGLVTAPFPEAPPPPTPEQIKSLDELIASLFPEQVQNPMNLQPGQSTPEIASPEAAIEEQGIDVNSPTAQAAIKLKRQEATAAPAIEAAPAGGVERRPLANVQPRRPGPGRDMAAYRQAIKDIESSGGKYDIVGPTHPKYGRALGAYQVMESNLPAWSREVLGRVVSAEEFLRTPAIQDQIFDAKFGQSISRYGSPEDAASVWFTGRPTSNKSAGGATDSLGTSGNKYVSMFSQNVAKYSGGNLPADRSSDGVQMAGLDLANPKQNQPQGDPTRPPPKQHVMGASYEPGEESESIQPIADPAIRRRQFIANAIKTSKSTASLKGLPRTEIVSILQEMGRGVAGVPRISKRETA